jgi:flagellar L-ring protein precursor FlgH
MNRSSLGLAFASLLALSACAGRLDHLGKPPSLTEVADPSAATGARNVAFPMPPADPPPSISSSLWQNGNTSFFRDRRARRVGDILTVNVSINEEAELSNTTRRSRDGTESMSLGGLFGLEQRLNRWLPDTVDNTNLVGTNGTSASNGAGNTKREETVNLKVAAVVTEQLPNGSLVIAGRQEVRVNYELRELRVAGVIRPEDIRPDNSIPHEKIAEARISYGGRGQIMDMQQPRYGQQFLDVILPF